MVLRSARLGSVKTVARRELVKGLRWLADTLREDEVVAEGAVHVEAATTAEPAPPAEAEDEGLADDVDAILMGSAGLSGDLEPALAARAEEARERDTDAPGAVDEAAVIEVLHTIYDPEIPVDIYELGLIYGVEVRDDASVGIRMTLTSPNCPAAQSLPDEVKWKVAGLDGVTRADVEVVFDPPWGPERMSEEARLELNL